MNVTVLGGLGYIGTHLVSLLLSNNYKVTILDNETFGWEHASHLIMDDNCRHITGDIRNSSDLAMSIKDADAIIHLAGLVGDPACSVNEDDTWLNNTLSTRLIADIANYYNVKRLIFASSCSVYGASPGNFILNEGSYLNPVSIYAKTKIDSERILFENFNGVATALRLATVFGFSIRMRFDLVINIFTINAIKTGKIEVFGGTQFRPFIHCLDAARAFFKVLNYKDVKKINHEVFNICVESLSIKELGSKVASLISDTEINYITIKEDDRNYKVSAEKAEWILEYKPLITVSDGIVDMYKKLKDGFEDWKTNKIYYNFC